MLTQKPCAAGPLGSTGVTPLHRYYGPSRHPLAFGRFPGAAGYTTYLAPPISQRDEEGFSSCSACPCHRATPTTPPEWNVVSVRLRRPMLPSPRDRELGLRCSFVTGPPVGSLALRPGDSLTARKAASSAGFTDFVSSTRAAQATGLLTPSLAGLTPAEHASLRWTHCLANIPSALKSRRNSSPRSSAQSTYRGAIEFLRSTTQFSRNTSRCNRNSSRQTILHDWIPSDSFLPLG